MILISGPLETINQHFRLNNGMAVRPPEPDKHTSLLIGFTTPDGHVLKYYNFKYGWLVSVTVGKHCYVRNCLTSAGAHRIFQEVAAKSMWLMSVNNRMMPDHAAQLVDCFGFEEMR